MLLRPLAEGVGRSGRCGAQSSGLPGASSGVRRGPVTGANIGMFAIALGSGPDRASPSRRKAAGASATPRFGTWTGFLVTGADPLGVEERFMNEI